jgi:adenosylhomocysteine nucleosidase
MICIQICSSLEWISLKTILKIQSSDICKYPYGEYINYKIYEKQCIFYHSGATKTRSAASCQFAIDKWEPNMVLVLGTCGGVGKNLRVADVIIANRTVQYDCIDRMDNQQPLFYESMTINIDNSWIDFSKLDERVYEGLIATADQDINFEVLELLRKENVLCADWESGAIACVCFLNKVKFCILRGISDIPEDNEGSAINQGIDYRKNTPIVMKKLIDTVLPVVLMNLG